MYIPKPFEVTDEKEIYEFVEANAFGQLVSNCEGRLFSTHIPFSLSNDRTQLLGHLAKQNPQVNDIQDEEILVTLQGAHDYISPSWYVGSGVSTWNFQSVHIYGHCKVFNDPEALRQVVNTLTNKYESTMAKPWLPEYNPKMLGAIVGIEITISEIQCQYKLSQNRSKKDQEKVIEKLLTSGSNQLAEAMSRNER